MNCAEARTLIESGGGDRDGALSRHLSECEACRRYDAVGAMLSDAVRAAPVPLPLPNFVADVMSAWRAEQAASAPWNQLARETWEIILGELVQAWLNTTNALAMVRDSVAYAVTTTLAVSRVVVRNR